MATTIYVGDKATEPGEIIIEVEELEEIIAPGINPQHNETFADDSVELKVEEMEEVIAPKLASNHNETLIKQ